MTEFDVGDVVRLGAVFRTQAGTPTNPTSVTLTVRDPGGTSTDVAATADGSGAYHADVTPSTDGTWRYRWVGTGAVATAEQGQFYVRRRLVPAPVTP